MAEAKEIAAIAERHGVSTATAEALLAGLRASGGRQVQFSSPELGGMGQWMPGMVMAGRMGDHALKARIDALCTELVPLVGSTSSPASAKTMAPMTPFTPPGMEWTPPISSPAQTSGSQNGIQYAYYARTNRLAIERDGVVHTYDTTGYPISGVSQAQSNAASGTLRFTTSDGRTVDLDSLKRVS